MRASGEGLVRRAAKSRLRSLLPAVALWLVSVLAAAAALALAELGAPVVVFVVLLVWLATLGLPTTLAFGVLVWLWPAWPLWLFVALGLVLSFVLQVFVLRWRLAR